MTAYIKHTYLTILFIAVANYPRELFECEKQAKEQIPLLFGLDLTKHNSGTSVGSDQAEAAPTSSNRTETTHSTAISDESNVSFLLSFPVSNSINYRTAVK